MSKVQFSFVVAVCVLSSVATSAAFLYVMNGGVAQAAATSIEATELRLVDAEGKVRGRVGMDAQGNARITFIDAQGVSRMWSGVMPDGTAMMDLRDNAGKQRIFLQVSGQEPLISLRDSTDKGRIYLQVSKDVPLINMLDKNSKGRLFANVSEEGPALWFSDAEGRTTFNQR